MAFSARSKSFLWLLSFTLLVGAITVSSAFANTSVSLVGVGDWSSPSVDPNPGSTSAKFGLGGGVLLGFTLAPPFRLEVGGLYVRNKTDYTAASSPYTEQFNGVQIPVLLRFGFNRFISFGVGGYYTHFIGQYTDTNDATGVAASGNYSDNGLSSGEFGLVGSLAIHVPITYTVDLTVDGRYNYGLTNIVSNSALAGETSEKLRDVQALVGLTFHMMR